MYSENSTIENVTGLSKRANPRLIARLKDDVYAGSCNGEIVILDLKNDKYFGLDETASNVLIELLGDEETTDRLHFSPMTPQMSLSEHAEIKGLTRFIEFVAQSQQPRSKSVAVPKETGGLSVCKWRPFESSFYTKARVAAIRLVEALVALAYVDWVLANKSLYGLVTAIESHPTARRSRFAMTDVNESLIDLNCAVQQARLWYPRNVDCLIGSGALAFMMLRRGIEAQFAIGVQKYPFYAHAWIEYRGMVVNDTPETNRRLAVLFRKPEYA